jgi:hypothetical protein
MKTFFKIGLFCLLVSTLACGGRTPSPKTAQSVAASYFKSYGKKYPSTYFGSKNVENVAINSVEEISYRKALVDTIVRLVDGHAARALVKMEQKFPKGWYVKSWELLQYR